MSRIAARASLRRHARHDRADDGGARVGPAAGAVGAVGRLVLLRRRRRPRAADVHHRGAAGRACRAGAAGRRTAVRPRDAGGAARVARLPRHGAAEQCRALLPDRLGAGAHRQRARLDPQCHDAAVHGPRRACADRGRAPDRAAPCRRGGRLRRRRADGRPRCLARLRQRRPGAARLPCRGAVLCLCRGLRPPLPAPGCWRRCRRRRVSSPPRASCWRRSPCWSTARGRCRCRVRRPGRRWRGSRSSRPRWPTSSTSASSRGRAPPTYCWSRSWCRAAPSCSARWCWASASTCGTSPASP